MSDFHNPYHFIPVKKGDRRHGPDLTHDEMEKSSHVRHDVYAAGKFSGKIICRLTTKTPILNGDWQSEGTTAQPREVRNFRTEADAQFPQGFSTDLAASSLRGMVGSLMEAASNSTLRVLEDKPFYSYRPLASKSLSAVGMIFSTNHAGRTTYGLLPLAPPTLTGPLQNGAWAIPSKWRGVFPEATLKVYIGNDKSIRGWGVPGGFRSWMPSDPKYSCVYGMKVTRFRFDGAGNLPDDLDAFHVLEGKTDFLLAQKPREGELQPRLWREIPDAQKPEYVPGILRVLGAWDRPDMPGTKEHELFLPLPSAYPITQDGRLEMPIITPRNISDLRPRLIPDEVVERFNLLADERTAEVPHLPYEPAGTRPAPGRPLRLQAGDLVYFDVEKAMVNGREVAQVSEISFSSIWRKRSETLADGRIAAIGGTKTFFGGIDPELLPMSPDRTKVTIAEQLLGFVEEVPKGMDIGKRSARALASRIRFSDAHLQPGAANVWYDGGNPVLLRILDSPKPPSSAFYFKPKQGPLHKRDRVGKLAPARQQPMGRKVYLHHPAQPPANASPAVQQAWRADPFRSRKNNHTIGDGGWKQYTRARLLNAGLTYYFDVRFDNLTREELALLVYSLSPAADGAFWHKFGMGKSIGLGSVQLDIAGLFLVDRAQRYTASGFTQPRYTKGWAEPDRAGWPKRYAAEASATVAPGNDFSPPTLRALCTKLMDAGISKSIELLGDPRNIRFPVHVPARTHYDEERTFAWFAANKRNPEAALEPVGAQSASIPALKWEWK
ncbi:MAG: hypothetical protein IPJ98_31125 [Bryobacterales bacterium]|nr:hypothetical protein [Bryobacterales bacterium]